MHDGSGAYDGRAGGDDELMMTKTSSPENLHQLFVAFVAGLLVRRPEEPVKHPRLGNHLRVCWYGHVVGCYGLRPAGGRFS